MADLFWFLALSERSEEWQMIYNQWLLTSRWCSSDLAVEAKIKERVTLSITTTNTRMYSFSEYYIITEGPLVCTIRLKPSVHDAPKPRQFTEKEVSKQLNYFLNTNCP
jgi:hypothetical protein